MIWHPIKKAPKKTWALYKEDQSEHYWGTDLLGFVEKMEDGTWDCFALKLIGYQPNKKSAMKMVQEFVLDKKP